MNLNQITIPSLNLEKAVIFYEQLGLRLIVNALPNYVRFVCPTGNATFSIQLVEKLPIGEGIKVYFECEKLDEYIETISKKGVVFDELPNDKPWLWREASINDPDNNQLVFYFAGDNRLYPPWRIN